MYKFTLFSQNFIVTGSVTFWSETKNLNRNAAANGDKNNDWLIDYLLFYVPLKNISLIWRRHHCRWRAAKFRPMLGAQGLWAGRDLYRATPTVTREPPFFRSNPKDLPIQSPLTTHERIWRIYSNPDSHGDERCNW